MSKKMCDLLSGHLKISLKIKKLVPYSSSEFKKKFGALVKEERKFYPKTRTMQ